jgi:hypothetical protein
MEVNIDEMTSTIDALGGELGPSANALAQSSDEVERQYRDICERMIRDALRTRAEDYDD